MLFKVSHSRLKNLQRACVSNLNTRLLCSRADHKQNAENTFAIVEKKPYSILNDVMRNIARCLRLAPTGHMPILSGIQPAELCRLGATISLAKRGTLDPDHNLHSQLAGSPDVPQERLKSRRSFVPAARKLLNDLSI